MRGTSSRSVFMAVGLACVVGISVGFACAGEARVAEQKAMYGGHRALVWAFDPQKPGDVRGFAEATLKPGAAQTLEPAKGHSIEFTLGPVGESEYHDGVKSWVEASVDLQAAHGSGRSNSTLDLTSPRVSVEYPHPPKWPLQ